MNVLTLFYTHGRGSEVQPTLLWILLHRAYLEVTRYFHASEVLSFLITRLLACSDDTKLHGMLQPLLKDRVRERIGAEGDALAFAMRVLVCDFVGIRNEADLRRLLPLQYINGGWETGWIYHLIWLDKHFGWEPRSDNGTCKLQSRRWLSPQMGIDKYRMVGIQV